MDIKEISIKELKAVTGEGLILQGCGGDPKEWVDGINEILTKENILRNGSVFSDIVSFSHEGLTNLLFRMEGVDLDLGALATWRIATHDTFGGTWLSDYLMNNFGVSLGQGQDERRAKPDCDLIGQDGNIFNLIGIVRKTLRKNGMQKEANAIGKRVMACSGYYEALNIISEYVNITGPEEQETEDTMEGPAMQ